MCNLFYYLSVVQPMMDSKANSFPSDEDVTLTIRFIMQGKEVGSIIGKKGEIVNRLRKECGAQINISDGSCPERIVTVKGHPNAILKLFQLLCKCLEEFQDLQTGGGRPTPLITLRLILPSSQCGSLIGIGGSKIKEIREVTGANIMVMSDVLPFSTERPVTISGTREAITQCIYHICCVMLKSPVKENTIPYIPMPSKDYSILYKAKPLMVWPAFLPGVQDHMAKPLMEWPPILPGVQDHSAKPLMEWPPILPGVQDHTAKPLMEPKERGLAALRLISLDTGNTRQNPAALTGSQLLINNQKSSHQSHKMTIPNGLMGYIIGKGGSTITEIRQISRAMIDISSCKEGVIGSTDRTITITGNAEAVMLAEYLITVRAELQLRYPISSE